MVLLVGLGGAGCALRGQGHQAVASAVDEAIRNQDETAGGYARVPSASPTSRPSVPATIQSSETETPGSLREFIVLALRDNPDIRAALESAYAQAERIGQVTALPDPMVQTKTWPEPIRTAEGDSFFILGFSQKIPAPGKLDRAGRQALEEVHMAVERWQEARLRVIADVKRAYFQLYILDHTIEITGDSQQLLTGLIDVARAQVAAGKSRQDDVLRAQVELSNLEAELIHLRQRRQSAAAMLNALLNRNPMEPVAKPADFDVRRADVSLEKLFAKAADHNPTLARFARQIERDKAAVELAKMAYVPDVTIGFEWMNMEPRDAFTPPVNAKTGTRPTVSRLSEDGHDNWAITFGFSVPLWVDRIEAGIREARRRLAASQYEYASAKNRIHYDIEDALERLRAQQELTLLFENTIIPQAEQTYRNSQSSYTAGESDFLYVIDNWQKWLSFQIQRHRSLGQVERSVADLEQAIGLSLNALEGPE